MLPRTWQCPSQPNYIGRDIEMPTKANASRMMQIHLGSQVCRKVMGQPC
jgi:hypothetical protein